MAHFGRVVVDEAAVGVRAVVRAAAAVRTPGQRVDTIPRPACTARRQRYSTRASYQQASAHRLALCPAPRQEPATGSVCVLLPRQAHPCAGAARANARLSRRSRGAMSLATASALAARRTVTSGSAGSGCVNWPQPRLGRRGCWPSPGTVPRYCTPYLGTNNAVQ